MNRKDYDSLLNRINQIESDSSTNKAIKATENVQSDEQDGSQCSHVYDFDPNDDDEDLEVQPGLPQNKAKPKRRKVWRVSLQSKGLNI